jgi:predicted nucleic acid-binding protein
MTAKFFVDTNVLIYAASNAAEDRSKRQVARALLSRPETALSAQVLQEFYAVGVTKRRLQMTHDEAVAVLQSLAAFPVCPITRELVMEAVEMYVGSRTPWCGPSITLQRFHRTSRKLASFHAFS